MSKRIECTLCHDKMTFIGKVKEGNAYACYSCNRGVVVFSSGAPVPMSLKSLQDRIDKEAL